MSAPAQPPHRPKRRPKLTARYRSFQSEIDKPLPHHGAHHQDDPPPRRTSLRRTGKPAHAEDQRDAQYHNSDVQTTAPSSPYDADEEDEGEPEHSQRRRRKRKSLPLSRPLAKHPRRVNDPHVPTADSMRLEREPVNEAVEDGDRRQIMLNTSSSGRHSEPDESENVFHAEPDVPGIKLWNHKDTVLVPGKVLPSQLAHVLQENRHYAIYVGQDATCIKYPGGVLDLTKPANRDPWMKELRKPPVQRRVMIIDPRSAVVPGPRKCPKLEELSNFLQNACAQSQDVRRRVFNAQYTDSYGFTQRQWKAMFSHSYNVLRKVTPKNGHQTEPGPARAKVPLQTPSKPPQLSITAKQGRPLRRARSVQYKEASSDPAEFASSSSDNSDGAASYQLKENTSPIFTPSSLRRPSQSASGLLDSDCQCEDDDEQRDLKREFLREFFAGSSSENEPSDEPRLTSYNPSSDESEEADETAAPPSRNQGTIENYKAVSPSSVVILSKTSTPVLRRLYYLHDSSASEDSLGQALDGSSFDDGADFGNDYPNDPQEPQNESLRLKLKQNAGGDPTIPQDVANFDELDNRNAHSSQLRTLRSSTRSQVRQDDRLELGSVPHLLNSGKRLADTAANDEHDVANCSGGTESSAAKSLRIESKTIQPMTENRVRVTLHNAELAEIPIRSQRSCIGNKERIGTNEKSAAKGAKNACSQFTEPSTNRDDHAATPLRPSTAEIVPDIRLRLRPKPRPLETPTAPESRRPKRPILQCPQSVARRLTRNSTKKCLQQPIAAKKLDGSSDASQTRSERQPLEEVYLWDFSNRTRSEFRVSLVKALEICTKHNLKMIYDGQDLKKGDERFGAIWSDGQAWVSRRGTKSTSRKVRVWDHCTGRIEKFCFSPPTSCLEQWLQDNPHNSLFNPSLYVQYEHRLACKDTTGLNLPVLARLRKAIYEKVVDRIRYLRVTECTQGPQRGVMFWNVLKRKCEGPRDFVSRSDLTRFLFTNPALELLRGQDALLQLELSTDLKLIHVRKECPADLLNFWDTKSKKTCVRPKELDHGKGWTVQECLDAEPGLAVYLGQDRTDTSEVQQLVAHEQCSASLQENFGARTFYTFMPCGSLMQKSIFSQGWMPKYIETDKESAAHATFWSKSQKALRPESFDAALSSIEDYLRADSDLELYAGQDLAPQLQKQLRQWFVVLRYEPEVDISKAKPALIPHSRIPLKYRAVRFTSGEELRTLKIPQQKRRKRRQQYFESDHDMAVKGGKRTNLKRPRVLAQPGKQSEDEDIQLSSNASGGDEVAINGREDREAMRAHSQEASNYEDENIDGSSGPGSSATPSNITFEDGSAEAHSESESSASSTEESFSKEFPNGEDHVRSASKLTKKMICVIREAGPKVLKRELVKDIRQTLREQLILEVESLEHLAAMVKDFNSHDFVSTANGLREDLQLLDIHGCFSCNADYGYAPYDLSTLREDFETGRICTSHEVITRFREICAGLIQYHEGSLLQAQASLLRLYGEKSIARFTASHQSLLQKENQMLRVFRICERAKQIGFVSDQRHRKSKESRNLVSLGSAERSLRIRARQPEITFLNYRDEKGNSVMGKRPSVRVFGFTIDTITLERNAGNIRKCHVCRDDVIPSQANSIRCANNIFNTCDELACRECLETVFSLERNEFKVLRDSENWFCMHCRGLCPSGSDCMKTPKELGSSQKTSRRRLVWPFTSKGAKRVTMALSKRHRSGKYDPLPDDCHHGKEIQLELDPSQNTWFTLLNLEVGAYRCQVFVDNEWVASTTFLEVPTPTPTDAVPGYEPKQRPNVPPSSVLYSMNPRPQFKTSVAELGERILPRGPRLRWHPVVKHASHAVHAIRDRSAQDGGTLVELCSRTEGYDWRRAKRHATLQWIPEIRPAEHLDASKFQDADRDVILCATDSERAHFVALDKPPTPHVGVSHKEFIIALNTFRYNQMFKSLWSIVTGRSSIHGIGLFTLLGYKKGDFVIEYAGDLIRTPLSDIRESRYDAAGLGTYFFKINDEKIVDATVQSNRARFTNHSCDPNMVADIIHVQDRDLVVLRATREIPRFTELTFDYKFPYEEAKVQCLCNAWNCVGVMN